MKRIGVLTGGGDTSALNSILYGIASAAQQQDVEVLGFMRGWAGLLDSGQYAVLTPDMIDADLGGTLLKTSRTKLAKIEGGYDQARANVSALGIDGLVLIGGDDTISVAAQFQDVPIAIITKTIDNDVGANCPEDQPLDFSKIVNYFTPGFPSAALRAAAFTSWHNGVRTTGYSHERIIVLESMGMSAGWLALASAYGHPDFIVVPEVPLDYAQFREKVARKYLEQRHVLVVIAEGAVYTDQTVISQDTTNLDAFGHAKPGGCAEVIARRLKADLSGELKTRNFNAVIPSYLYRCGAPTPLDKKVGTKLGRKAVQILSRGQSGKMASVRRTDNMLRIVTVDVRVLPRDNKGNIVPKRLDLRLYDRENLTITSAGVEYFRAILGEMPEPGQPAKLETRPTRGQRRSATYAG